MLLSGATAALYYLLTVLANARFLRRSPIALSYGLSRFALHRPTAFGETDVEVLPTGDLTCAECDLVARGVDLTRRVSFVPAKTRVLPSVDVSGMGHSLKECHLPGLRLLSLWP